MNGECVQYGRCENSYLCHGASICNSEAYCACQPDVTGRGWCNAGAKCPPQDECDKNSDCLNGVCMQTCCEFKLCMENICEASTLPAKLFKRKESKANWSTPFFDPPA
jgi:hypothetical protein